MAPFLPIALGLAKLVPDIIGFFKGDDAEEKARDIVGIAQKLTGTEDPQQAVDQVIQDPALQLEFQKSLLDYSLKQYQEGTKRLEMVNSTIRAEMATSDNFRGRWRPYWGYVSGTAFGFQIFGIMFLGAWAIIMQPDKAAVIIAAIAGLVSALTVTWGIALTILGVAIKERSKDKVVVAGSAPPQGMIDAVMGAFKKG